MKIIVQQKEKRWIELPLIYFWRIPFAIKNLVGNSEDWTKRIKEITISLSRPAFVEKYLDWKYKRWDCEKCGVNFPYYKRGMTKICEYCRKR